MNAIFQTKYGKPEVLTLGYQPKPLLQSNQVLILNHATSVNPRDCLIRAGRYQLQFLVPKPPLILGSDCAGTVIEVGKKVKNVSVGDRVYGMKNPSQGLATYAEYVSINAKHICKIPSMLSFEEAAGIPLVALTAWQAFQQHANVKATDTILIIGGSGGVGGYAVQIAKALGKNVHATSSQKNIKTVEALGADKVFDYNQCDILKLEDHYDIIFDTVGSGSLATYLNILKSNGTFISTVPSLSLIQQEFASRLKSTFGIRHKKIRMVMVKPNGAQLNQISKLIDQQNIRPYIDSIFNLEEAKDAHLRSQSKRATGKIILRLGF